MDCLETNKDLKEFSKKLHLVDLPSPLWGVHTDPEYRFIAIIYVQLKELKLDINKGVLITFDNANAVINASFLIHNEIVYLPELNSTIKTVVDLSHVIYLLHNLKLCANVDNPEYSQCNKYVEFGKYDIFCNTCLCMTKKEGNLWRDFNNYTNSLSPEEHIANNSIDDNICCVEIDIKCGKIEQDTDYNNYNITNTESDSLLRNTNTESQENCNNLINIDSHKLKLNRRSFSCKQCDKSFLTKHHLQEHLRSHSNDKKFLCEICNKTSNRQSIHQKHILTHSTNPKRNLCNVCGKTYCQRYRMKDHLLTHSSERPFKCDVCPKTFAKNYNLKLHQKTHLGIHPFVCSVCGKAYTSQSNLATHVRSTHTNKKPYACNNCDMTFVYPRHLRIHMRKHTGEKPFNCVVCGKTFAKNIHLTIHMRTHTGERPHLCTICGKGFTTTGNLSSHKKVHHKDADSIR